MQDLIETLQRCVHRSVFVSERFGTIRWQDYGQRFRQRRWNDATWMLLGSSKLEIDNKHVADLAARLEPVLAEFLHTKTGRVGNGLFLLLGGRGSWAHPTLSDFAKTLISGAAKLGARPVVKLLLGWAGGEPLRFRTSALLYGADIDGPLQLAEGIALSRLPRSSADLPASLPAFQVVATVEDFLGAVVMSVDCEMSPALYQPYEGDTPRMPTPEGIFRMASNQIPNLSLDTFCESISLASNGYIDWILRWEDLGDLAVFSDGQSSISYKYRSDAGSTKITQAHLQEALKIHHARHRGGGSKANLELAMRRWRRSKRSATEIDKLIDLRIALEALYEIGGMSEKGFRIATYGAWHLGKSFEERHEYRETLRRAYHDSSSAIHGGTLKYAAKDKGLVSSTQDICRNGILKRLLEAEKPKWDEIILCPRE